MIEHLESGDQTMAPEDPAWQAMPHFVKLNVLRKDLIQREWRLCCEER